jgi:hypothetical protein
MKRNVSLIIIFLLFVFFGPAFINLCSESNSNACHGNKNNFTECCLKSTYVSENAKFQILPSFDLSVQTINLDRSEPEVRESFTAFEIRPHLFNYSCLVKFIHPSNAPPLA